VKDLTELTMAGTRWWLDAWTAQANAVTTIALRLPILMGDPNGKEAHRMVSEKVLAARQGAMAAGSAATEMMMAAAGGAGPVASARAWLAIAEAAATPAQRRVRKNANRLIRRKKP
jgi:hypothetical protein